MAQGSAQRQGGEQWDRRWPRHYMDNPEESPFPEWSRRLREDADAKMRALAEHIALNRRWNLLRLLASYIVAGERWEFARALVRAHGEEFGERLRRASRRVQREQREKENQDASA